MGRSPEQKHGELSSMKNTPSNRVPHITRREAIASLALSAAAVANHRIFAQNAATGFAVEGDHFVLKGKPLQVLSGEMHYARVPRAYWATRMKMIRAMGLNTLATYVFWNVHEPKPGVYDFADNNDLVTFIKLAQSEGLHVLLRAGPYSCAEWEFGGFPAWLLADPKMNTALRSNDPAFMQPVERWLHRLAQEVGSLQIENGGPIIATQIENEYGNFSNDHAYMNHMRDIFIAAGFNKSLLYTVDPSRALAAGEIDGIFSGVNFGSGHAATALDILAKQRPGQPLFATEYWPGWFDLWGHPHETRPIEPQLADLDIILSRGASLNLYMVHGGTSFGMMAGASQSTGNYRGNVTSYDYDAPIDEAGHTTPKFFAYRDLILKHTGEKAQPIPEPAKVIAVPEFQLQALSPDDSYWGKPIVSQTLLTMEQVDQAYGYIYYNTRLKKSVRNAPLVLDPVHDYAQVYVNGTLVGSLDRHYNQTTVMLDASEGAFLGISVENTGRLNSTKWMRDEWKGLKNATLSGIPLTEWMISRIPFEKPPSFRTTQSPKAGQHFAVGTFHVDNIGDTFLDVSELGKGVLWLNGRCLGRFWNIGPQQTLYVPGPWLKQGENSIVAYDMFATSATYKLRGLTKPILDGPTPTYADDPEHKKKPDPHAEFAPTTSAPSPSPQPKE
jgi:beta-galactosidase